MGFEKIKRKPKLKRIKDTKEVRREQRRNRDKLDHLFETEEK